MEERSRRCSEPTERKIARQTGHCPPTGDISSNRLGCARQPGHKGFPSLPPDFEFQRASRTNYLSELWFHDLGFHDFSFPPPGSAENGGGSGSAGGRRITFAPGAPSPTCASQCGILCTGFFCLPNPTGKPADQWDPIDPASPSNVSGPGGPIITPPPLPGSGGCPAAEVPTTTRVCNARGTSKSAPSRRSA